MKFVTYKRLVLSDLYRISGDTSPSSFFHNFMWGEGFKYCFWFRTCRYVHDSWLKKILFRSTWFILNHYKYKFGISIPFSTEIGSGFYIGHFGNIFVSGKSTIGKNCNISHEVTIGVKNRGPNTGVPNIGDNVYIGPGAKIFGDIVVGNHVAIGANCVVTKDVPDHAVVVGAPFKIISFKGSNGYVNRTDYDDHFGELS